MIILLLGYAQIMYLDKILPLSGHIAIERSPVTTEMHEMVPRILIANN